MKHVLLVLLIGCGSSQPSPAVTTTEQAQTTAPDPAPTPTPTPTTSAPKQGEKCGENDACAEGLTCISYYGIAGPRGPQFKSCEIPCKTDTDCPTGNHCATIADGPGQVCRS